MLEPFPNLSAHEFPLSWTVTGDASEIGTDYASLGNPSLLPDRFTGAVRSETSWAGFALTAFAGRIEDNVNDADEIPRARADAWSLEFSFAPAELLGGERRGWLRWLGMPALWGNYRYDRLKPVSIPASFQDPDSLADTRTDAGYATAHVPVRPLELVGRGTASSTPTTARSRACPASSRRPSSGPTAASARSRSAPACS